MTTNAETPISRALASRWYDVNDRLVETDGDLWFHGKGRSVVDLVNFGRASVTADRLIRQSKAIFVYVTLENWFDW